MTSFLPLISALTHRRRPSDRPYHPEEAPPRLSRQSWRKMFTGYGRRGGDDAPTSRPQARLRALVHSQRFTLVVTGLIVINAVILTLETSASVRADYGTLLHQIDQVFVAIFVAEVAMRLYADRLAYYRCPWNVFDFAIVLISCLPVGAGFAVLRALRILRVLRIVSLVPSMRVVVVSLLKAVPGMASIGGLLTLVFFVCAVMATRLFGTSHPEWFGTLGQSMYTLFQVMTLESWSEGIVRPIMSDYPYAWLFFLPFILATTFVVLNLFIAVIVNTMSAEHAAHTSKATAAVLRASHGDADQILADIGALRQEIRSLQASLASGQGGAGGPGQRV